MWPVLPVSGGGVTPISTKVIISNHNYESTPDDATLRDIIKQMWSSGADVAKIATTATDVSDAKRVLNLLKETEGTVYCLCKYEISFC